LSVVIPYFETGELIIHVLQRLYDSIATVLRRFPQWELRSSCWTTARRKGGQRNL
jgi:hypothetical protein